MQRLSKIDTAISLLSTFSCDFQTIAHETRQTSDHPDEPSVSNKSLCIEELINTDEFLAQITALKNMVNYETYRQQFDDGDKIAMTAVSTFEFRIQETNLHFRFFKIKEKKEKHLLRRESRPFPLNGSKLSSNMECIDSNLMSGFWSMMEGEPMATGFPVTTRNYNIYDDKKLDWLNRTKTTCSDLEGNKSRVKCESWIKKNELQMKK